MDNQYLNELEEKHGGKISNRLFSLFYGDSNGKICEHGIFMYQIGSILYFEDFEYKKTVIGIEIKEKTEKYVKFEGSFDLNDVKSITNVSERKAIRFCKGKGQIPNKANILQLAFGKTLKMLTLDENKQVFLDLPLKTIQTVINSTKEK